MRIVFLLLYILIPNLAFAGQSGLKMYNQAGGFVTPSAPVNTAAPVASGDVIMGYPISCSRGSWSGVPTPTYTYQFRQGGVDIGGATSNPYTTTSTTASGPLDCVVTATNASGSASQDSNDLVSWTPLNLQATYTFGGYWDATNAASITDAGGGSVSQWNDLSSAGNNATQGTNANRPITGTRTINSLNALDCDGTNDNFTVSTGTSAVGAVSLFSIYLPDNATTGTTDIYSTDGNSGGGNRTKTGNQYADFDSTTSTRASPASGSAIVQLACVSGNGSGRTQTLKVNDDATITATVNRVSTAPTAARICSNGVNANFFNGALMVQANIKANLCGTPADANKLLAWGAWRAAITPGTLP